MSLSSHKFRNLVSFFLLTEKPKALVLDVKCGKGCFNKTKEVADVLAKAMVMASNGLGIQTTAFITEMDNPIGRAIGNSVEVAEALECLRGKGPQDLKELICMQGKKINTSSQIIVTIFSL